MAADLIRQCQMAIDCHDAALVKWPGRNTPVFKKEMDAVIASLETILRTPAHESLNDLEQSRTYRWLGDAYFDRGQGADARRELTGS